jgi:hypothetical protein
VSRSGPASTGHLVQVCCDALHRQTSEAVPASIWTVSILQRTSSFLVAATIALRTAPRDKLVGHATYSWGCAQIS